MFSVIKAGDRLFANIEPSMKTSKTTYQRDYAPDCIVIPDDCLLARNRAAAKPEKTIYNLLETSYLYQLW